MRDTMFHSVPPEITQQQLSTILEELHDEVYVFDAKTLQLVFANKTARLRCDWKTADIQSKKITDASANFSAKEFYAHVEPLLRGETETVTVEGMHEKGLVEISTRILSTWGDRTVFVSVLRDREHRRQLERARTQAFSEIVHDLRTPLTSILGAVKLMDSGPIGDIPPQAQQLVQLIQRNAENLLSIVGDILDLQKLGSQPIETEEDKEQIDLVELTKEAMAAHMGYCAVHNVSIDLLAAPEQAPISGFPIRLHQMFANLLSNAIKNSPAGEVVHVKIHEKDGFWRVAISNAGPGIPEDMRESIFQNYVQGSTNGDQRVKGTGLGLAICKKIVKSHGGEIGLSCDTGDRTTFFVKFPQRRTSAS